MARAFFITIGGFMGENTHRIEFKLMNKKIPYYDMQFKSLLGDLKKQIDKYNENEFELQKYVELVTICEGIQYYYDIIQNESFWDENRRKSMCNKLVRSANRSIFAYLSEHGNSNNSNTNADDSRYMIAYREYLQTVSNLFRKSQVDEVGSKLIFSCSMDLMGENAKMDQPFSIICDSQVNEVAHRLCAVFLCLDRNKNINDAFAYLPMLTHEVSHNFKYIERSIRNKDVTDFLLNSVSNMIIRQLFAQVSDNHYDILLNKVVDILTKPVEDAILYEIKQLAPDYIINGKLDILPSLVFSVLNSSVQDSDNLNAYYHKDVSEYEILKKSFTCLAKMSDLEWYFPVNGNSEYEKLDDSLKASMLIDLFANDSIDEVRAIYTNICFEDKDSLSQIDEILEKKKSKDLSLSISLISEAVNVILLSVMKKIKKDFIEHYKSDNQKKLLNQLLLSLAMNAESFETSLKCFIDSEKNSSDVLYDLIDRCIQAKSYINSIFLICKFNKKSVVKEERVYNTLKRIYENLHDKIQEVLNDSSIKPYFSSRNIHSSCIKLGLFNEKDNPDIFIDHYRQMFREFGKDNFIMAINEYLNLYREVFADLTMCAIFQFDQLGYFKYMVKQYGIEYETVQGLSKNMTLDRIHTVMRVLERDNQAKGKIKEYYSTLSTFSK